MTYPSLASRARPSAAPPIIIGHNYFGKGRLSPSQLVVLVDLLDRDRNALADADAHGCQGKLPAPLLHAVHRRQRQSRAAHAERMAERDRAAMRVDEVGVVLDAQLPQAGYSLRGEGFIELDQIEVSDLDAETLHQLTRRRHRPNAHDARRHRGGRQPE